MLTGRALKPMISLLRFQSSGLCQMPLHAEQTRRPVQKVRSRSDSYESNHTSSLPQTPIRFAPYLLLAGATQGPLLDGIHGTKHLLEYQMNRVDIGGLHSSLWVPVLLGTYYVVLGVMHVGCDALARGQSTSAPLQPLQQFLSTPGNAAATQARHSQQSWPLLALNTGVLAALLYLSAVLFDQHVDYGVIAGVLAVAGVLSWRAFDGTKQGLLLGILCALAAPLSELVIINVFGLWEYTRPDVFGSGGLPSWVPLCYFFYTPAVGNLSRLLATRER